MRRIRAPRDLSSGRWPAGPFTVGDDELEQAAAAGTARLVATLTARRSQLKLSRAALAQRAGVSAHTVGRIEAGQTWPDLAVVLRLAHVMGVQLRIDAGSGWAEVIPAQRQPADAAPELAGRPPLQVGLAPSDAVTSAHVIEALLHHAPRLRAQVEQLTHQRRSAGRARLHQGRTTAL